MKKILFFGLLAAAVIATASCSKDDEAISSDNLSKGIVLRAIVDQAAATRATLSDGDAWTFAFSKGDMVLVHNGEMSPYSNYMFTKGDGDFTCPASITTKSPIDWYAYFPNIYVYFSSQSGKKEDVANMYALSGTTASKTTGEDGLSIAMAPQVAILVIDNQKGPIDINVKTGPNSWVGHLKAKTGSVGFDLVTEETKVSLLTTEDTGTYYIAVPAGVQLCIKDGDTEIKSTKETGYKAGKYYEITVVPAGALHGKFTINEKGDQVFISKGNLWSDDEGIFHFEDNQYDFYSGDYNTSHISHFMWSKNADVARALQYNDLSAADPEVFFTNGTLNTPNPNFTVNGQTGMWRTLSYNEWKYLINNNGSVWTTINGVNGLIIFCDGYSGSKAGLSEIPVGCLFLPAAGYRIGNNGDKSISDAGSIGDYWYADSYGYNLAAGMRFNGSEVVTYASGFRYRARAIRLVTECQSEPSAE